MQFVYLTRALGSSHQVKRMRRCKRVKRWCKKGASNCPRRLFCNAELTARGRMVLIGEPSRYRPHVLCVRRIWDCGAVGGARNASGKRWVNGSKIAWSFRECAAKPSVDCDGCGLRKWLRVYRKVSIVFSTRVGGCHDALAEKKCTREP